MKWSWFQIIGSHSERWHHLLSGIITSKKEIKSKQLYEISNFVFYKVIQLV